MAKDQRLKVHLIIEFVPFGLFSAWVLTSLNDRSHLTEGSTLESVARLLGPALDSSSP